MKIIAPQQIDLTLDAPRSKSAAHRTLLAAALCEAPTRIDLGRDFGSDIAATLDCLGGIGAGVACDGDLVTVTPGGAACGDFPCRESGSTLRFFLPVAAATGATGVFSGSGRLPERPLDALLATLKNCGLTVSATKLPLSLSGKLLQNSEITLPGDVSSQYVTGFLFALAAAGGGKIHLTSKLQSVDYVYLTIDILQKFGIAVDLTDDLLAVSGKLVSPGYLAVEGDWSNGAALLALGALAGRVTLRHLDIASRQGDRRIVEILRRFGIGVTISGDRVTAQAAPLAGVNEIDIDSNIDLAPTLAVVAAKARGITTLVNARRLRLKESDRLHAIEKLLTAIHVQHFTGEDFIEIHGNGEIPGGGTVDGCNDHRIVMAATLAGIAARHPVTVTGENAVEKSFPQFFQWIFSQKKEI